MATLGPMGFISHPRNVFFCSKTNAVSNLRGAEFARCLPRETISISFPVEPLSLFSLVYETADYYYFVFSLPDLEV